MKNPADYLEDPIFRSRNMQAYALRQARQRELMAFILNTIEEGILVINAAFEIQHHNAAAQKLLGLPNDLSRVKISQFIHDEDFLSLYDRQKQTWSALTRREIFIDYPQPRVLQLYVVPHGDVSDEATLILHDVTDSKERDAAFLASEKMRMVALLTAGVAHEIGNPLNSISLQLQLLHRMLKKGNASPEALCDVVDTAQKEVERLDRIIREFLEAVRPRPPQFASAHLHSIVKETLKLITPEIEQNGMKIRFKSPEMTPELQLDAGQIQQVLINLIKNAAQASKMPDGIIDIVCSYDDLFVKLEITDYGCGIPLRELPLIFQPFHTTKRNGTGLGLMVVERVVREHGGEIAVRSEEGKGTTFTLTFPIPGRRRLRRLTATENDELIKEDA